MSNITTLRPRRHCAACRAPLKPGELTACAACTAGSDFIAAALAFQRANPRRDTKRARAWR